MARVPRKRPIKQSKPSRLRSYPHQDVARLLSRTPIHRHTNPKFQRRLRASARSSNMVDANYRAAFLRNAQPGPNTGEIEDQEASPAREQKYPYSTTVNVHVGKDDDRHTFVVPNTVLVRSSPFFKAATKDMWQELSEFRGVELSDFSPAVFHVYLNFLYAQELDLDPLLREPANSDFDEGSSQPTFWVLYDLYQLGNYIQAWAFTNAITDHWIEHGNKTGKGASYDLCNQACDTLPPDCSLRNLIVSRAVLYEPQYAEQGIDNMGETFKSDLIRGFFERVRLGQCIMNRSVAHGKCAFHEHGDNVPRCEQAQQSDPQSNQG